MFDRPPPPPRPEASLTLLARADAAAIKALAEAILPELGAVEMLKSATGLVMLPMRDSVRGTAFHLGEVLVAEAHLRLRDHGAEGYGMIVGRDLERATAMALVDAAEAAGLVPGRIADFRAAEAERQAAADTARLCAIEATRVDMETF